MAAAAAAAAAAASKTASTTPHEAAAALRATSLTRTTTSLPPSTAKACGSAACQSSSAILAHHQRSAHSEALNAALASAVACLFSNPIDLARVRMQTSEPHTRSPVRLLYSIARREGAAALTRGLAVSFPYNIVLNGVRFSAYASLNAADRGRSANAGGAQLVHGALAGSLAGFLAAPLAQARTILQSEPGAASTDAARLGAALRALRERPLAGASSWAVRNGGHTAITFSLYGHARRELERLWPSSPSALLALASSMQAAAVSCVLMNPVDLISTRLFHRASLESQLRYAGSATLGGGGGGSAAVALTAPRAAAPSALSCLTETLHSEGVAGLYRGLSANVLRIVPHTVITFAVLELLRDLRS